MKSLNSKTDISIFINLSYLRLKMLNNRENNEKICHIFHHNFKNIPCYVMSEVSLKRFYFALFDDGLTLKTLKMAFIGFWIQTLHMFFRSILAIYRTFLGSWTCKEPLWLTPFPECSKCGTKRVQSCIFFEECRKSFEFELTKLVNSK